MGCGPRTAVWKCILLPQRIMLPAEKICCSFNAFCFPLTLYGLWGRNRNVEPHCIIPTRFVPVSKMRCDSTHFVIYSQTALRLQLHRISLSGNTVWRVGRERRCGTAFFYPNAVCYPLTKGVNKMRCDSTHFVTCKSDVTRLRLHC